MLRFKRHKLKYYVAFVALKFFLKNVKYERTKTRGTEKSHMMEKMLNIEPEMGLSILGENRNFRKLLNKLHKLGHFVSE